METAAGTLRSPALRRLGRPASFAVPARDLGDEGARVLVGALFLTLAYRLATEFLSTGHLTGLLLMTSELLVVILTIVRKPAIAIDRTWAARIITTVSLAGPPLLRPVSAGPVADGSSTARQGRTVARRPRASTRATAPRARSTARGPAASTTG